MSHAICGRTANVHYAVSTSHLICSYSFDDNGVEEGFLLFRDKFNVPDYAIFSSSLIKTEIPYSLAMKWINDNAKSINSLLNQYNSDSNIGLVLVLAQWSTPGYSRIVVPSNHIEHGIVMGLSNGTTWVQGESPEGKPPTLSIIEHYYVRARLLRFHMLMRNVERGRIHFICQWIIHQKGIDLTSHPRHGRLVMLLWRTRMEKISVCKENS